MELISGRPNLISSCQRRAGTDKDSAEAFFAVQRDNLMKFHTNLVSWKQTMKVKLTLKFSELSGTRTIKFHL